MKIFILLLIFIPTALFAQRNNALNYTQSSRDSNATYFSIVFWDSVRNQAHPLELSLSVLDKQYAFLEKIKYNSSSEAFRTNLDTLSIGMNNNLLFQNVYIQKNKVNVITTKSIYGKIEFLNSEGDELKTVYPVLIKNKKTQETLEKKTNQLIPLKAGQYDITVEKDIPLNFQSNLYINQILSLQIPDDIEVNFNSESTLITNFEISYPWKGEWKVLKTIESFKNTKSLILSPGKYHLKYTKDGQQNEKTVSFTKNAAITL